MRYRPFAHFNMSVSAISLVLADESGAGRSADDWMKLVYAALENGINSFEVQGRRPAMIDGLNRALQYVERRLVFVAWRLGPGAIPPQYEAQAFDAKLIEASVQSALARTGLEYLDLVLLDDPGEQDLSAQALAALRDMKARGLVRFIGVAGEDDAIDAYISTGAFDALALPFNMTSGWRERLRLRAAHERDMAVIGYGSHPPGLEHTPGPQAAPEPRRGLWRPKAGPAQAGPYAFLAHTPHWSADEICLAFALTEPSIATVQVQADSAEALVALAAVPDREMPSGLSAQIEMARISAARDAEGARAG